MDRNTSPERTRSLIVVLVASLLIGLAIYAEDRQADRKVDRTMDCIRAGVTC